jgi:uncharacterized protein (DUF433 family)
MAMRIEIPDELGAALAEIGEKTGQDAETVVAEMVTEAIKMRRVRRVHFEDGATGRRACVPGTGIPVWEIAEFYEYVERDFERLHRGFDWLTRDQLQTAISYYEAYPEEIEPHLKTEEEALAELHALWEKYPQTKPKWLDGSTNGLEESANMSRESVQER